MKLFSNLFKKLFLQIKKHLGLAKPTATEALYSLQKSLTREKKDQCRIQTCISHCESDALPP